MAAGFTAHLNDTTLNWPLVLLFSAAAIIGSLIAAPFAVLILLVAAFVLIRSITALVAGGI